MRTPYRVDRYQETYFVIGGFDQLFAATEPDFAPIYPEYRAFAWDRRPNKCFPGEWLNADQMHAA